MQKFKPMERSDLDHIKSLIDKMLIVDADAFKEIRDYMTSISDERNED